MEQKYFEQFKKNLEAHKKEIERKLKELEKLPEFGNDTYDAETLESQEFANQLSMAEDLKKELIQVDSALVKFKKGKYGICEKCGKKISLDILRVAPESRWCRDCKRTIKH